MNSRTGILGTLAAAALIQTVAKAHGVFNSPTTGEIKYVDPASDDEKYHSPKLTAAEARVAHERGLIEDFDVDNDKASVDDTVLPINDDDIRLKGVERTAEFAQADADGGTGSGTLDSRSSTAWEDRERVEGGVEGSQMPGVEIDTDSGDADAPPAAAPAARGGRRAANKAE